MCFSLATRKLLELLEAPFNNIRVVSSVLGVLKGTQEVFGLVFCCFFALVASSYKMRGCFFSVKDSFSLRLFLF
jgi:hypothetical protein